MIAKLVAAAVLYWLFQPGKKGEWTDVGEEWTAKAPPTGDVSIADWVVRFVPYTGEGEWSDDYRTKDKG